MKVYTAKKMLYNLKNNSPFPDQTIPDCTISHLEIKQKHQAWLVPHTPYCLIPTALYASPISNTHKGTQSLSHLHQFQTGRFYLRLPCKNCKKITFFHTMIFFFSIKQLILDQNCVIDLKINYPYILVSFMKVLKNETIPSILTIIISFLLKIIWRSFPFCEMYNVVLHLYMCDNAICHWCMIYL